MLSVNECDAFRPSETAQRPESCRFHVAGESLDRDPVGTASTEGIRVPLILERHMPDAIDAALLSADHAFEMTEKGTAGCGPQGRGHLDRDEVDTEREAWQSTPIGQDAHGAETQRGAVDRAELAPRHTLLGGAERRRAVGADLDDHEPRRRPRIDGDEVELRAADPHVRARTVHPMPARYSATSASPVPPARIRRVGRACRAGRSIRPIGPSATYRGLRWRLP